MGGAEAGATLSLLLRWTSSVISRKAAQHSVYDSAAALGKPIMCQAVTVGTGRAVVPGVSRGTPCAPLSLASSLWLQLQPHAL